MVRQKLLLISLFGFLVHCALGFHGPLLAPSVRNLPQRTHPTSTCIGGSKATRIGLRHAARSHVNLKLSETEAEADQATSLYSETVKALVQRYEDFLDWKSDTNGYEMQDWRIDNRVLKMESQNITKETAPDRAMEAILRTRERYVNAFMDDGANATAAQNRADDFVADTARSLEIIWKEEKERFVAAEESAEQRSKNLVVLANIFIFTPLVLAFLSTMPVGPVIEMTKYYVANSCIPIGGIKCNGEGPQGQRLPNIQKMFTPPKKIVRSAPANSVNRAVDADSADTP